MIEYNKEIGLSGVTLMQKDGGALSTSFYVAAFLINQLTNVSKHCTVQPQQEGMGGDGKKWKGEMLE